VSEAKGRLLGIDYGRVRIGLAVSDRDRIIASPLATYTRKSEVEDAVYFAKHIAELQVVAIVVGLPLHSDGSESEISREARSFGEWIKLSTRLPVVFWDERFTSDRAEEALLVAKMNPRERKAHRDKVAAQMILQAYLDAGCPVEGTQAIPSPIPHSPLPSNALTPQPPLPRGEGE
jgi:putative Holliday junction resolvase